VYGRCVQLKAKKTLCRQCVSPHVMVELVSGGGGLNYNDKVLLGNVCSCCFHIRTTELTGFM
jgi:hypothetical protein